ncbi:MAG: COX15/CtaA family protein [Pseudomonadota bacterium]
MTSLAEHSIPTSEIRPDRAIGLWLLACAGMVFVMALLGAVTRLSESGLSIMEWAPVSGALPPLGEAEWQRLFALYKEIPEYQERPGGMTLAEFKAIFWWEYIHRLWGRLIGLVFAVPFLWFLLSGRIVWRRAWPYIGVFALGGLQGAMGWFMVASGFADRTDVSQYRLVAHLSLALAIYGWLLWLAWQALGPRAPGRGLSPALVAFTTLAVVTILSGGFVAGLNGGFVYNTFPLMGGQLVPSDYGFLEPWIANHLENPATAQFNHRVLAVTTVFAALGLWLKAGRALAPVAVMALIQLGLGIATLLLVVPIWLGAAHQAGALILFTLALRALYLAPGRADV